MNASVNLSVSESCCRREIVHNVICPKPRWHFREINSYRQEVDAKAGAELLDLDIILSKGSFSNDQSCAHIASSPPFFCGSPPSRVSNPLIQDTRFRDQNATPVSPTSSGRKPGGGGGGGCVRPNFGTNPAVRIEGFDCDHRDRSISTLA